MQALISRACEYVMSHRKGERQQLELSLLISRILKRDIILHYPDGPNVIIMGLKVGRGRQKNKYQRDAKRARLN